MQADDFRNLVRRARARDATADECLYRLVLPYVERAVAASGRQGPGDSVSDGVQKACSRILEKPDRFRGTDEAGAAVTLWGNFP
jgi:hypothetical protein